MPVEQPRADVAFSGGPVLTMDAIRPRAAAVRDGRIVDVGSAGELPGLVDPYTHFAALVAVGQGVGSRRDGSAVAGHCGAGNCW